MSTPSHPNSWSLPHGGPTELELPIPAHSLPRLPLILSGYSPESISCSGRPDARAASAQKDKGTQFPPSKAKWNLSSQPGRQCGSVPAGTDRGFQGTRGAIPPAAGIRGCSPANRDADALGLLSLSGHPAHLWKKLAPTDAPATPPTPLVF